MGRLHRTATLPRAHPAVAFISDVTTTHGRVVDSTTIKATLARLAAVQVVPAQLGYNTWSLVTCSLNKCDTLPVTILTPMSKAVGLEIIRVNVRDTLAVPTTSTQHDALVNKVTEVLSHQSVSTTDWFMSGALRPSLPVTSSPPCVTHHCRISPCPPMLPPNPPISHHQ